VVIGAAVNLTKFLPFALFGAFAAATWLLLEFFSSRKPRAEQRLDEFRDPKLRRRHEQPIAGKKGDAVTKVLEKATPALAKPLQPKNEEAAGKLKKRLAHAGFRTEAAPTIFLGLKFACLLLGVFLGGGWLLLVSGIGQSGLFRSVMVAGAMFYLPDAILFMLVKRRKEAVFLALPDALDLLVVCVEAGLGLDQAMRKVAEEMKKSYPVIAEEFGLSNLHLQMGRARGQVLQELGDRSGVEDLRSMATILIQADKFGSSIAQALRVQSDSMRTRRRQIAEERAAKTAVKLIFPLVIFIFPGIFVVLVGPAAITMIREMLPVMGGR
jgi:tight adherence protein C